MEATQCNTILEVCLPESSLLPQLYYTTFLKIIVTKIQKRFGFTFCVCIKRGPPEMLGLLDCLLRFVTAWWLPWERINLRKTETIYPKSETPEIVKYQFIHCNCSLIVKLTLVSLQTTYKSFAFY